MPFLCPIHMLPLQKPKRRTTKKKGDKQQQQEPAGGEPQVAARAAAPSCADAAVAAPGGPTCAAAAPPRPALSEGGQSHGGSKRSGSVAMSMSWGAAGDMGLHARAKAARTHSAASPGAALHLDQQPGMQVHGVVGHQEDMPGLGPQPQVAQPHPQPQPQPQAEPQQVQPLQPAPERRPPPPPPPPPQGRGIELPSFLMPSARGRQRRGVGAQQAQPQEVQQQQQQQPGRDAQGPGTQAGSAVQGTPAGRALPGLMPPPPARTPAGQSLQPAAPQQVPQQQMLLVPNSDSWLHFEDSTRDHMATGILRALEGGASQSLMAGAGGGLGLGLGHGGSLLHAGGSHAPQYYHHPPQLPMPTDFRGISARAASCPQPGQPLLPPSITAEHRQQQQHDGPQALLPLDTPHRMQVMFNEFSIEGVAEAHREAAAAAEQLQGVASGPLPLALPSAAGTGAGGMQLRPRSQSRAGAAAAAAAGEASKGSSRGRIKKGAALPAQEQRGLQGQGAMGSVGPSHALTQPNAGAMQAVAPSSVFADDAYLEDGLHSLLGLGNSILGLPGDEGEPHGAQGPEAPNNAGGRAFGALFQQH